MALIVAYLPQLAQHRRLARAVAEHHEVRSCHDWPALFRECASNPVRIAIVDLHADGAAQFDQARRLRTLHPHITLIAWTALYRERARDLFDAGRYGFDGLIITDTSDSPDAILDEISRSEGRGLTSAVKRMLGIRFPASTRDALLVAVSRAHERLSADSLARLVGLNRRQLTRMLAREGFPSPSLILTWGRLLVAAHLLENEQTNADAVARQLRFPSGSAFRNTCRRYLNMTPQEIRAGGGSAVVMSKLNDLLTAGKADGTG